MKSKKLIVIAVLLTVAVAAGFFIHRAADVRARAAKTEAEILKSLTAEEINLVLKSQSAGQTDASPLAEKVETRQVFLKGLREYLALAAEARREGLTQDENFKINFEYKKNLLLADLYRAKLTGEQGKYFIVPKENLDEVWQTFENEKRFETDMETLRAIQTAVAKARGDQAVIGKLQGGALTKARENWANAKVLSEMAKADAEFMSKPEINLRIRILEAGILSADYLRKHWAAKIKATDREISEYLGAHPEYDVRLKREKAALILQKAMAGEDFARLAAENSEDRPTRANGGLYENVSRDTLWAEVEAAALSLENGRIAGSVIETNTGFHIVKLENKQAKKSSDGSEILTFSVRHILLQKGFEDPHHINPVIPAPFLSAPEIARSQIEKTKRDQFVTEIIRRAGISLPDDFTSEAPENAGQNSRRTPTYQ